MTHNDLATTSEDFTSYLIQHLNTEDEKNFILHFKLFLDYGYNNKKYPVNFDDVWRWCEFTQKNNAKRILLKHFKENEDYIILSENDNENRYSFMNSDLSEFENDDENKKQNGGQNKETIMLNVDTFKEFCMKASTTKAKQIRSYYIKLEKIFFLYTKEQLYKNNDKIKTLESTIDNFDYKQNKIYKDVYNNKNVVYIIKLQSFDNGKYIIKIGYSDNLKDRISKLSSEFCIHKKQLIILNIYPCEENKRFELYLHNHNFINKYKYSEIINNKAYSTETYKIDDIVYEKIKNIIDNNIIYYSGSNIECIKEKNRTLELQIKKEELDLYKNNPEQFKIYQEYNNIILEQKKLTIEIYNKLENNPNLSNLYNEINNIRFNNILNINTNSTNEIIKEEPINTNNINTNNTNINTNEIIKEEPIVKKKEIKDCGPIVQVYDGKDTSKLLYVFNGITDATRKIEGTSYTGIKNANYKKQLYKDYRWHFINRNDTRPNEPKDIGESVISNQKLEGKIGMLNLEMTTIEKVFLKQKDAAKYIGQNVSAMCIAINNKTKLSNKYFLFWDTINEDLKNKYLETNELPEITEKLNAKKIYKIHPETNDTVKVYLSISDLSKEINISPKTIKKYSNNNTIYNGFKWKIQ